MSIHGTQSDDPRLELEKMSGNTFVVKNPRKPDTEWMHVHPDGFVEVEP